MMDRLLQSDKKVTMKENQLVDLSKAFAIDVVTISAKLRETREGAVLMSQLLRSGTSIGANIHEANYAASKADFINKMQIALKECYETEYWLELFQATQLISEEQYDALRVQSSKIRKLLTASINTAKSGL